MTVGYLCAIGIALVFMLYMDGTIGVMMLSFLLLMPLISAVMTLLVRRRLRITLELPDSVPKHQKITAVLKLEKDTILPLPFLRLRLTADAHFDPLNPDADPLPEKPSEETLGPLRYQIEYRRWKKLRAQQLQPYILPVCLSMGTARESEYRIPLTARFCGGGRLTVGAVQLSDYFGMFRFRMQDPKPADLLILPEIPELKANTELFRSVATAAAAADEETETTPSFSASAMPGYEHREYIPGDSLKRINWKLSSKRRHLMVRQDEPIALARLAVVMDFRRSRGAEPTAAHLEAEEHLIETALGFLMLCARNGYPCKLFYPDAAGEWTAIAVDYGEQVAVEAVNLLRGGFRPAEELAGTAAVPPQLAQETESVLLWFAAESTPETAAMLEQLHTLLYLVVPERMHEDICLPDNGSLWYVTADHSLKQAGGENA